MIIDCAKGGCDNDERRIVLDEQIITSLLFLTPRRSFSSPFDSFIRKKRTTTNVNVSFTRKPIVSADEQH